MINPNYVNDLATKTADRFRHKGKKSGHVYKSDHPLTDAERKQIDDYDTEVGHKEINEARIRKGLPDRQPALAQAPTKPKKKLESKKGIDFGNPNEQDKPVSGENAVHKLLTEGRTGTTFKGLVKGGEQDAKRLGEFVRPITEPIGKVLGALPGVPQMAARVLGHDPVKFGGEMLTNIAGKSGDTGDIAIALDPNTKPRDRAGAIINSALPLVMEGAPALIGKAAKGLKSLKETDYVGDALKGAEGSGIPAKATQKLKAIGKRVDAPAATPKPPQKTVQAPEVKEPTGIAHAEVDKLRKEIGWSPRESSPKPDAILSQEAKKYAGNEETVASRVLDDADGKATLADEEAVALGRKLTDLKAQMLEAKAANNIEAFDLADDAAQKIANALDESGSRQGRAFRARRFLFDGQEDAWTINRRAKKANMDQPLNEGQQKQVDKIVQDLEAANAALKAERDAAVKNLELFKGATLSKRAKGPLTPERRRAEALASLKKLGVPVGEDVSNVAPSSGGMRSKQSGAINIPEGETEQIAKAVRSLVRSYSDEGLSNWNGVLKRLQKDLPGIEEDQALFILSGKYKTAKLEADLAKRATNRFLSDVQREAISRSKPLANKALQLGIDALTTVQRSLQTTGDNSLALIQGKNVLMWKPGTWFKAVGNSLKAGLRRDPIAYTRRVIAEIENHPLYSRAVQSKLSLSDVDGAFTKQEEFFAGQIENKLPGLANSKAMATVLANKLRFDLFRKLAAAGPDTPEYLADIAQQINIVTGRGHGKASEVLGSKLAGNIAYAPRFYLSTWQHNLGVPLFKATTKEGKVQALKMYGTQLAFYGAAIKAAQLFGFEVELDPRSTNFGVATAKDGSYSFDLFKKQAEPIKLMAQALYGKISKGGKFTEATDSYNAVGVGDYIEQKASPALRMTKMLATGSTYDDTIGKQRPARASDIWSSYIPLSIKEMYKNREKPGTFPASFLGGNIDKGQSKSPKVPLKAWPPPGLKKMMGG